eukprot:gnl/TRDRNA2_/TRDRNA2_166100_c0_seq3.p1 gnl/TRDRNA2_/TRDRNA2_166100_c0~~gnl/TRDRNA2_/TRDRNA2_166100_c0_seq3.p1  ORF type:complete len:221 (-),score=14.61 gnl/TRDRNA2_/TRDRNA2_166100_c0_seq3:7-669(-)
MHRSTRPGKMTSSLSDERLLFTSDGPFIFDIGSNRGQDTMFYLSLGYRVVAVDANPEAVRSMNQSFARHISNGALRIVHAAVVADKDRKKRRLRFCSKRESEHSHTELASRYCAGTTSVVRKVTCGSLLRKFGQPTYMKIDIEGHDMACIETIPSSGMPRYISLEVHPLPFDRMDNILLLLEQRGYIWFKLAFQSIFCPAVCPFGCGSGLFGEDHGRGFT